MKKESKFKNDIKFVEKLRGHDLTFHSTWGLFSPKKIDHGSSLLVEHIEINEDDTILDIGCGYGPIGLTCAKSAPKGIVHMVDKDFVAIEYAKKNAKENNLRNTEIYLSNGLSHVPSMKFDTIISNLPAKVGNELLRTIMEDSKKHLKPGGTFYVVVISGLKEYIKRNFKEIFGNYKKIKQSSTYMVAMAVKDSKKIRPTQSSNKIM